MAKYVRTLKKQHKIESAQGGSSAPAPVGERVAAILGEDELAWHVWFAVMETLDKRALVKALPECFHDLVEGRELCPDCGEPLGYLPGSNRMKMFVACSRCGYAQEVAEPEHWEREQRKLERAIEDVREHEAAEKRYAEQRRRAGYSANSGERWAKKLQAGEADARQVILAAKSRKRSSLRLVE